MSIYRDIDKGYKASYIRRAQRLGGHCPLSDDRLTPRGGV